MIKFGFKKNAKLIKTDEFSSVFNFRKRISGTYLVMHYMPNTRKSARLGLVVGKKTAKRAVDRNYMRRVLREWFRLQYHTIAPLDLVIRVQRKFNANDFTLLRQELDMLIMKLNQRTSAQFQAHTVVTADSSSDMAKHLQQQ